MYLYCRSTFVLFIDSFEQSSPSWIFRYRFSPAPGRRVLATSTAASYFYFRLWVLLWIAISLNEMNTNGDGYIQKLERIVEVYPLHVGDNPNVYIPNALIMHHCIHLRVILLTRVRTQSVYKYFHDTCTLCQCMQVPVANWFVWFWNWCVQCKGIYIFINYRFVECYKWMVIVTHVTRFCVWMGTTTTTWLPHPGIDMKIMISFVVIVMRNYLHMWRWIQLYWSNIFIQIPVNLSNAN